VVTILFPGCKHPFRHDPSIKGEHYDEGNPWRGDIVVAKLSGQMQFQAHFSSLIDASMADFAIIKNHFLTSITPNIS